MDRLLARMEVIQEVERLFGSHPQVEWARAIMAMVRLGQFSFSQALPRALRTSGRGILRIGYRDEHAGLCRAHSRSPGLHGRPRRRLAPVSTLLASWIFEFGSKACLTKLSCTYVSVLEEG